MKNKRKQIVAVLLLLVTVFTVTACDAGTGEAAEVSAAATAAQSVWDSAVFTEDTTLGEGNTTVAVEVKAEEKSVTFTLKTDKTVLGDALTEHHLIAGEEGAYGLYVKVVNGIKADYDTDGHYWSLCRNGEALTTGVDSTEIKDGEHYELVYAS